jgi:hypothetical protein
MTESPAETLRRAAEKARGLAAAATPGPWKVRADDSTVAVVGPDSSIYHRDGSPGSYADAAYIAAMHPGVLLAVAGMWDAVADESDGLRYGQMSASGCAAVDAALELLREAP